MTKLTNVAEAADFIHQKVKDAKKKQAKEDRACCAGVPDLLTSVYAIRNGAAEVLLTCDDDAMNATFSAARKLFNGDIVVIALDGVSIPGERTQILTVAVDREGDIGFVQQFYDVTPEGLSLDKPTTVGKPSFLKKHIKKDMREIMAAPGVELPPFVTATLAQYERLDASPEAIQAFIDKTVVAMIKEYPIYIGVNKVALIAEPDSPRGRALVRPGLPLLK